jgi:hypothetical protein
MRQNNAGIERPAEEPKKAAAPHGCSLLPGYLAIIFRMLVVAGCASTPPAPVRVEVPMMVPCIGAVRPRPAYKFEQLTPTATDGEIILALARDWTRGGKYKGEHDALLAGR